VIAAERPPIAIGETGLEITLDRPLPASVLAGRISTIFCAGTCFHPRLPIAELAITVNGVRHRPTAQRMPRLDRFRELHPGLARERWGSAESDPDSSQDPELRSYRSGFWATVPVGPRAQPGEFQVEVAARLADGTEASGPLGTIAVVQEPETPSYDGFTASGEQPLIAICMATYNPDMELFRAQVESIRAQTDRDWICLISDDCSDPEHFDAVAEVIGDDGRFVLSRSERRLSFYRNFERALRMVPAEAELVALSDHDDRWYPDKLEALRGAIGAAALAYSDLRRVDVHGEVREETLWQDRRNNSDNLASLAISNTIVGASCLFRRRVLEYALPFPSGPGWDFHDHWLALVAMSLGEVAYVDRPLYDYVQHPGAVLGRAASKRADERPGRAALGVRLEHWRGFRSRWRSAYFSLYLQRDFHARLLLARCGSELTPGKRRALQRVIAAARSPLAFAWLEARRLRKLFGRNETLGMEAVLARGILWRHLIAITSWGRSRPGRSDDDASVPSAVPQKLGPRQRRWLARR
jgi:glycosyltransferase involved in cell wall biosynthesis